MNTHLPGFQSFFRFLHHFVLAKLATSRIRVKGYHSQTCGPLVVEGDVHYLPAVDKFQNPPIKSAQLGGEQDPVEKANNLAEVAGER